MSTLTLEDLGLGPTEPQETTEKDGPPNALLL